MRAVADAVQAGVSWVQIRDRELEGGALVAHADAVASAAREAAAKRGRDVTVIVNRRVDVALAIRADGVHLGFDAVDAATARELMGPAARIGISAHSPDEIAAAGPGVSYAHLAPIFAPISKASTRPPLGLDALREASTHGVAVIAQGGIDAENAAEIVTAGAAGIAVTGAVLGAQDPGGAAARLVEALASAAVTTRG